MTRVAFIFVSVLLAFAPMKAAAETFRDVAYGSLRKERMDIYAPARAGRLDVVVFVHGGGWRSGNKRFVASKPDAFNANGYVFVSVGYPYLPRHPVEAQAGSLAKAIVWLSEHIPDYGGNPNRIHIVGHSAGGHLASLVATDPRYLRSAGGHSGLVDSVVSLDGPSFDIPQLMSNVSALAGARAYLNAFGSNPSRWRSLSPLHHIEAAYRGTRLPRILLVAASQQQLKAYEASNVVQSLSSKGGSGQIAYIRYPKETAIVRNHLLVNRNIGAPSDPVLPILLGFFSAGR